MRARDMAERPLSRQPECRLCGCEEHIFTRCHTELGRVTDSEGRSIPLLCPCPSKRPTGIYEEPS